YQMDEIENAAYEYAKSIDNDERVIVGLNKFAVNDDPEPEVFPINPELERGQKARLGEYKAARDQVKVQAALAALVEAAKGTDNVLYPMKEALRVDATLGEISDALRGVFGVYQP
ncbi:MAG: isobutyryl-CoA mutase large subunit, partial [Actinomycetota bacterium]